MSHRFGLSALAKSTGGSRARLRIFLRRLYLMLILAVTPLITWSCGVVESEPGSISQVHTKDALMYFLPTGRIDAHIIVDDQGSLKITVNTLYLPDATKPYFFRYTESWLSSDKVGIKENKYGLLTEVASSSQDATPQILGKLAEAAAKTLQFLAVPVAGGGKPAPPKIVFDSDYVIDPTDPTEVRKLNDSLAPVGLTCLVQAEQMYASRNVSATTTGSFAGIYYRPLLPYRVTFYSAGERLGGPNVIVHFPPYGSKSVLVYLPNEAPILAVQVSRKAFVKNTVKLEFDSGVLESVAYDKPSEGLGLAQIPADLAKTVLTTASSAFVFRYQDMNTDQQLVSTQKQLGNTQDELIQTQQKLIDSLRTTMEAAQLARQRREAASSADIGAAGGPQPPVANPDQCKPDASGTVPPGCP